MAACPQDELGPYVYDTSVRVIIFGSGPVTGAPTGIADVAAPTAAEVTGGVDVTDDYCLSDIIGWEVESEIITAPPWGAFVARRPTVRGVSDARLVFAADRVASPGSDIRTLLRRGDAAHVMILPSGTYADHPSAPVNVYPTRVADVVQRQVLGSGRGSEIEVTFAVTGDVGENVVVVS